MRTRRGAGTPLNFVLEARPWGSGRGEDNMTTPIFRDGRQEDAPALAELVNMAGEGMPLQLWDTMREPGESAWDVGRRRAAREKGSFSWSNAKVAEIDGEVAAALIGYAQPSAPEPVDYDAMPPVFVPLQELENLALNTWYVNVLAVFPRFRRRGLGTQFMAIAEEIAAEEGKPGLSIIVSDINVEAKRLYLACGFRQTASRPKVKDAWQIEGDNWLLLTKAL
jgi:ribosomal protein S18 acetylase RimI-like enzyme